MDSRSGIWRVTTRGAADTVWTWEPGKPLMIQRSQQIIIALLLAGLVLLQAFQCAEILDMGARLDALEEPPAIVYPDIAIDTTVPRSPAPIARHKASLKYKTKSIMEVHNGSN